MYLASKRCMRTVTARGDVQMQRISRSARPRVRTEPHNPCQRLLGTTDLHLATSLRIHAPSTSCTYYSGANSHVLQVHSWSSLTLRTPAPRDSQPTASRRKTRCTYVFQFLGCRTCRATGACLGPKTAKRRPDDTRAGLEMAAAQRSAAEAHTLRRRHLYECVEGS